jgi:hypothetical protein
VAKTNVIPYELKKSLNEQPTLLKNKKEELPQFIQNKRIVTTKSVIPVYKKNNLEQAPIIEPLVAKAETSKHIVTQETIALSTTNTITSNNLHVINNESNNHASLLTPVNNHTEEAADRNYTKLAVYKELDTDDERKSLYVGSVEINKDKIRGFLRKASSLFKGKNKSEEEKTEISNSPTLE